MTFQQNFINDFLMKYILSVQMFLIPSVSAAPQMLPLEQESSVISGEIFIDMTKVVFTNIQSKNEINASCPTLLPLCKKFARSVHFQCCYTSLLLKYLPISLIRIKEIEIKDHGIRILNFAHDTTIFLKNSTCHSRIQVI